MTLRLVPTPLEVPIQPPAPRAGGVDPSSTTFPAKTGGVSSARSSVKLPSTPPMVAACKNPVWVTVELFV